MQLRARAPGSLMLLGEHAVLFGKPALVCAVNQFITVTLTPALSGDDDKITIDAKNFGYLETSLANVTITKPFQFVLAAIQQMQPKIKRGFRLDIAAEFSDQIGFGSSAAVTVTTLASLSTWLGIQVTPLTLIRQGRQVVRLVQGIGSGADIAASVYGGIVAYKTHPLTAERINHIHPLSILYSGYKTPTLDVIRHVQNHFAKHSELLKQIVHGIGECAEQGALLIRRKDWQALGEVFDIQQGLMEALNVSNVKLQQLINQLREDESILGAKISGSGLGDCVIGLGRAATTQFAHGTAMDVAMTLQGVWCEKI